MATNWLFTIAIDRYRDGLEPLGSCVREATVLRRTLQTQYRFIAGSELRDEAATVKGAVEVLNRLANLPTQDRAILFFSGHGSDQGDWCMIDGRLARAQIHGALRASAAESMLVIADCCDAVTLAADYRSREAESKGRWLLAAVGKSRAKDGGSSYSPFTGALLTTLERNYDKLDVPGMAKLVAFRAMRDHMQASKLVNLSGSTIGFDLQPFRPPSSASAASTADLTDADDIEHLKQELATLLTSALVPAGTLVGWDGPCARVRRSGLIIVRLSKASAYGALLEIRTPERKWRRFILGSLGELLVSREQIRRSLEEIALFVRWSDDCESLNLIKDDAVRVWNEVYPRVERHDVGVNPEYSHVLEWQIGDDDSRAAYERRFGSRSSTLVSLTRYFLSGRPMHPIESLSPHEYRQIICGVDAASLEHLREAMVEG